MNDLYDIGEPSGGDDPSDRVHSFHSAMESIRTTNIDSFVEFYNRLIASSLTTALEEHQASRTSRYNEFDCCISLIPAPATVSVTVTGPTSLGWKQSGTLTANASGGSGTYTYKWYQRAGGTGSWNYTGVTTKSISVTMVQTQGVEYKTEATSGGNTATDTHFIEYCDSSLCMAKAGNGQELRFELESAYPNPFDRTTQIGFVIPEPTHVRLTVYDVTGREVVRLVDRQTSAGSHVVTWNAEHMPGGVYFYRLEAGFGVTSRAVTLLP